jgi:hypothetical protein
MSDAFLEVSIISINSGSLQDVILLVALYSKVFNVFLCAYSSTPSVWLAAQTCVAGVLHEQEGNREQQEN